MSGREGYDATYYQKHKREILERNKRWWTATPERIQRRKAYLRAYRQSYLVRLKAHEVNHLEQLKVLMYYSNPQGIPVCNNCGEQDVEVLCVDHVAGGGNKHAEERNSPLSRWLIKNNYPKGFQVLCGNCNMRKAKLEY